MTLPAFDLRGKSGAAIGNGPSLLQLNPQDIRDAHDYVVITNWIGPRQWGGAIEWDLWITADAELIPVMECRRYAKRMAVATKLLRKPKMWPAWEPAMGDFLFDREDLWQGNTVMRPAIDVLYRWGCRDITTYGMDLGFIEDHTMARFCTKFQNSLQQFNKKVALDLGRAMLVESTKSHWTEGKLTQVSPIADLEGWEHRWTT